jgi:hypothetical protein
MGERKIGDLNGRRLNGGAVPLGWDLAGGDTVSVRFEVWQLLHFTPSASKQQNNEIFFQGPKHDRLFLLGILL